MLLVNDNVSTIGGFINYSDEFGAETFSSEITTGGLFTNTAPIVGGQS